VYFKNLCGQKTGSKRSELVEICFVIKRKRVKGRKNKFKKKKAVGSGFG